MAENIDYDFLSDLEGGCKTVGYIPAVSVSNSGITIATGFDLGQRNENDLISLQLDTQLVSKLKPYLGLKGKSAQNLLKSTPFVLSAAQSQSIDKAVKSEHVSTLKLKYDSAPDNKIKFINLPPEAQTVIASVSFQYGTNLDAKAPKFWKTVTSQNWLEAIKTLQAFGDAYPTRRKKEAALLEQIK